MKRALSLLLLLGLAGCATTSATDRIDPNIAFEDDATVTDLPASAEVLRAEAALVAGRLREAKALLEAAVSASPRDARALFDLALVLELGDDLEGAERRYREVLAILPDFAEALNNLGLLLRDRQNLAEARTLLERAIAERPGYGEAHGNLGLVLEEQGDIEGAVGRFRAATRLLPEDPVQHANLGFALLRLEGRASDARVSLLRARRLAESDAELLREIAGGLRAAGDAAESLRIFDALIPSAEDDRDRAVLHVEAALSALAANDRAAAERHATEAVRLEPEHAGAYILLGRIARDRGDTAAARRAFEMAKRHADAGSAIAREADEALAALR